MIIVTGGAGLIGSNLVEQLNQQGHTDILVVDHLKNGQKMHNLADLHIRDYLDRDDFMARVQAGQDGGLRLPPETRRRRLEAGALRFPQLEQGIGIGWLGFPWRQDDRRAQDYVPPQRCVRRT